MLTIVYIRQVKEREAYVERLKLQNNEKKWHNICLFDGKSIILHEIVDL